MPSTTPLFESRNLASPTPRVAVVIPCFRVTDHLAGVLSEIQAEVQSIYCVIDGCDQGSLGVAQASARDDQRIHVLEHERNQGVGSACITGYLQALADGAEIIVKLDGDGQMCAADIPNVLAPLLHGEADYVKGNRFSNLEHLRSMPTLRLLGNAGLSFFSKLSSGYWNIFDPTNGFTAIHSSVARQIPWERLHRGYFFESDLLFRLYTLRAVVVDQPLPARYAGEQSNLNVLQALTSFPIYHCKNFLKRIFYCYYLRDFNLASLNLLVAVGLLTFGLVFGVTQWVRGIELQQFNSAGTVMLAALPLIMGWQALLAFLSYDMSNIPHKTMQRQVR